MTTILNCSAARGEESTKNVISWRGVAGVLSPGHSSNRHHGAHCVKFGSILNLGDSWCGVIRTASPCQSHLDHGFGRGQWPRGECMHASVAYKVVCASSRDADPGKPPRVALVRGTTELRAASRRDSSGALNSMMSSWIHLCPQSRGTPAGLDGSLLSSPNAFEAHDSLSCELKRVLELGC